jgi:hypothetical protein
MTPIGRRAGLALAVGAAVVLTCGSPSATPLSSAVGGTAPNARAAEGAPLVDVQYRRRRSGAGAGAFIAGAIIGGIIASQPGYYYDPYYGYPYYHYPYRPYYRPYVYYDPAIAYCMRRFRSYDPYSRTYLGYDGRRHPCP